MSSIKDGMTKHHRALDDLLDRWDSQRNHNIQYAAQMYETFADELEDHIEIEEQCVFPLYETQFIGTASVTPMLKQQHQQLIEQLNTIKAAAMESRDEMYSLFATFRRLLDVHNATEEYTVYPWLDGLVSSEDQDALIAQINNVESIHNRGE